MEPMRELIDERTVESALTALAIGGPLVGGALGALAALVQRRVSLGLGLLRGFELGLLGPLVWVLWRLFGYLTRFAPATDPKHDYFGLERVDILALNLVLFVAVGATVGLVIRRVRRRDSAAVASGQTPETQTDHA